LSETVFQGTRQTQTLTLIEGTPTRQGITYCQWELQLRISRR